MRFILKIAVAICIALLAVSCNTPFSVPQAKEQTVTFNGSFSSGGAYPQVLAQNLLQNTDCSFSRSAVPSYTISNTGCYYFVSATRTDGTSGTFTLDKEDADRFQVQNELLVFTIELSVGTWRITAGIKNADDDTIFSDSFDKQLTPEDSIINHCFYLSARTEGQGTILLDVDVDSSLSSVTGMSVTASPAIPSLTKNLKSDDSSLPKWARISASDVPAGVYELFITFENAAGIPLYTAIQKVNVLCGCTTDTWVSDGSGLISSSGFKLTSAILSQSERNIFYVGRTSVTPSEQTVDDTNCGSAYQPLKTVSGAIQHIMTRTSGGNCVIYVSGQIRDRVSITPSLTTANAEHITIKGLNGLDENNNPNDGLYGYADELNGEQNFKLIDFSGLINAGKVGTLLSVYTPVPVVLENISLTKGIASRGAGLYVDSGANVTMQSGVLISQNRTGSGGGGVMVRGTLTMNGGKISSNSTYHSEDSASGGGVLITKGGNFTLNDGEISGNRCSHYAGGVFVGNVYGDSGSNVFTMNGGKICGNTADGIHSEYGSKLGYYGALFIQNSTDSFTMTAGEISSNTSNTGKDGISCAGTFNISGSAFIPNNAAGTHTVSGKINIAADLTPPEDATDSNGKTIIATLAPITYATTRQVLTQSSAGLIRDNGKYFALVPKEGETWNIDNLGYLTNFIFYNVSSAADVKELFASINAMTSVETENVYINFENDIDLSSVTDWMPIGYATRENEVNNTNFVEFRGVIDGNGHTLKISDNQSQWFSVLCRTNNGIIQNIKLTADNAVTFGGSSSHVNFGGFCIDNKGVIKNCWNDVSCNGVSFNACGGICENNEGTIENCINTASVTASFHINGWGGFYAPTGGIAGEINGGTIKNCVNYGQVTAPKKYDSTAANGNLCGAAGAIVGYSREDANVFTNCYWRYLCVRSNITQNYDSQGNPSAGGKFSVEATDDVNWMLCLPQYCSATLVRKGTFTGNGYFESNTDGTLTAANADEAVTAQTLQYGSSLLNALNAYVAANTSTTSQLSEWSSTASYAAVPSCFAE